MTTYSVTDTKLQELNVLIDKGGHIPTDVSDALASLQIALASGAPLAAQKHLTEAIEANKRNAAVYTSMQEWHDSVKASAPPVEPPVVPPSGPPVTIGPGLVSPPLQPWELRRLIGAGDAIYWMGVAAAGQIGNALGSGSFTLLAAVLDQPPAAGVEPAWQTSGTGLHAPLPIKVGQWYVWKFTGTASQEMRPQLQA